MDSSNAVTLRTEPLAKTTQNIVDEYIETPLKKVTPSKPSGRQMVDAQDVDAQDVDAQSDTESGTRQRYETDLDGTKNSSYRRSIRIHILQGKAHFLYHH